MAGTAAGDATATGGTSDVVARGLKKTFWAGRQPVHAVVDVSFDMKHGEVTGLLGQNGAAKTNPNPNLNSYPNPNPNFNSNPNPDIRSSEL